MLTGDMWHVQHGHPATPDPGFGIKKTGLALKNPALSLQHFPAAGGTLCPHQAGEKLRFLSSRREKPRCWDAGTLPAVSVGGSSSGKQRLSQRAEGRAMPPRHVGVRG